MKLIDWLKKWHLESLKINLEFLEAEIKFSNEDKKAAWELYVELLTRITTQTLSPEEGDEKSALDSIYSIFPTTREILKKYGTGCVEFTKVAVIVLNQIVRPFTAKWHKHLISGHLSNTSEKAQFRTELEVLQKKIRNYTKMLSSIAGVEDLTEIEE